MSVNSALQEFGCAGVTSHQKLQKHLEETVRKAQCPPAVQWWDLLLPEDPKELPPPTRRRTIDLDLRFRNLG